MKKEFSHREHGEERVNSRRIDTISWNLFEQSVWLA